MSQPSPLAELQLLPMMDYLARVGRRAAETVLGDLRPRHMLVMKLLDQNGAVTQQGIAEALSLDPSNVVALLSELETRKLISRHRDPTDRRRHIIQLTAHGSHELTQASVHVEQIEADLFAALSIAEREKLRAFVARAVLANANVCAVAMAETTDLR